MDGTGFRGKCVDHLWIIAVEVTEIIADRVIRRPSNKTGKGENQVIGRIGHLLVASYPLLGKQVGIGARKTGRPVLVMDIDNHLIFSAFPVSYTHLLQGLWNYSNTPPWESDIHSNINVQMNYWPVEPTNLAECHEPFINYIYNESQLHDSWKKMAAELDCSGWVLKTQNNIFGYSDWNWNRPANAWYCMHVWDKYRFNPDSLYLANVAYPVMKSACQFWFDRLIVDDDGKLVAPNEWSPEHGPWEAGIPYAQQLIWDLFSTTLEAGQILGNDPQFVEELKGKLARLDQGLMIGSWGQLREWKHQEDDSTEQHRHVSHLIGLYPCLLYTSQVLTVCPL